MKVLCLGGSGGMGRYATKAIVNFEELETITIADLNKDAAEEFANSFDAKVQAIGLDVTDNKKLVEARKTQMDKVGEMMKKATDIELNMIPETLLPEAITAKQINNIEKIIE